MSMDSFSGRTMVHDYQLTTIGNALKYFGYSFNSVDENELADAERLLLDVKPHLFAINSDYQPSMRSGDAWMTMCWTGDGKQMNADMPEIEYVLGREGGELWSDFFAIPKGAPHTDAAYALIDFLVTPRWRRRKCWRTAIRWRIRASTRCCRRSCWTIRSSIRRRSCSMRWSSGRRHADRPEPGRAAGAVQVGLTRECGRSCATGCCWRRQEHGFSPCSCCRSPSCSSSASESGGRPAAMSPPSPSSNTSNLPARWTAFKNTLTLAPFGTLLALLIAYPLAYFLAMRADPKWRTLLLILVIVPFWTSILIRSYAWIFILGGRRGSRRCWRWSGWRTCA
jgi:ABC-type sugar transport system permease subunit